MSNCESRCDARDARRESSRDRSGCSLPGGALGPPGPASNSITVNVLCSSLELGPAIASSSSWTAAWLVDGADPPFTGLPSTLGRLVFLLALCVTRLPPNALPWNAPTENIRLCDACALVALMPNARPLGLPAVPDGAGGGSIRVDCRVPESILDRLPTVAAFCSVGVRSVSCTAPAADRMSPSSRLRAPMSAGTDASRLNPMLVLDREGGGMFSRCSALESDDNDELSDDVRSALGAGGSGAMRILCGDGAFAFALELAVGRANEKRVVCLR